MSRVKYWLLNYKEFTYDLPMIILWLFTVHAFKKYIKRNYFRNHRILPWCMYQMYVIFTKMRPWKHNLMALIVFILFKKMIPLGPTAAVILFFITGAPLSQNWVITVHLIYPLVSISYSERYSANEEHQKYCNHSILW